MKTSQGSYYPHSPADFSELRKIKDLPMVYVITTADFAHIKVGLTKCMRQRLSNIQSGCPFSLSLWLAIRTPIPEKIEQYVHNQLRQHNTRGEWFSPDAPALDWMVRFFTETNRNVREVANALV